MEITVALVISILSAVMTVVNFATNRKDKAVKEAKEDAKEFDKESSNQVLIDYRLTQVKIKLDKILDILDSYDKEIDARVEKALEQHILLYHKGAK